MMLIPISVFTVLLPIKGESQLWWTNLDHLSGFQNQ